MSEDHSWPVSNVAELEAGVDVAAQMLQRYNPALDTWDLPRTGEFWDAVADAHRDTHTGRDTTVAVIDGGFDTTIPALSGFPVDGDDPGHTAHGSVVALLVRQVAPEAQLRLFTVTRDGAVDPDLVASAIRRAAADGAQVINLSLGWKVDLPEEVLRDVSPSQVVGWRRHLRLPPHPVSDAVAEARAQGVTVIAACGNKATSVLIPAVTDDALAIGFLTVLDLGDGELSGIAPTGYSQSRYADVKLVQPANVLGSSFASPLFAGFAATSPNRDAFRAYATAIAIAAVASDYMIGWAGTSWNDAAATIDDWFKQALLALPHRHLPAVGPCHTCAVLAVPAYLNWGLWKLRWSDLDGAEELFRAVTVFAPSNAKAKANLAVTLAAKAALT